MVMLFRFAIFCTWIFSAAGISEDAVSRMLTSMDRNGDNRIDRAELAAFATSQGMDASAATQELSAYDADGDGMLNILELAAGTTSHVSSQGRQAVPAPQPDVQAPIRPLAMPPMGVSGAVPSLLSTGTSERKKDAVASSAQTVVEKLSLQEKAEEQAEAFARRASELRANSTALTKAASQRALRAGASAADQKAKELLDSLAALEQQAGDAEAQAAFLRRRSKSELEEADEFSQLASSSMKQ
eukprot:TRINITY_DN61129_c0_g1_i1.p1 TRINITY_DN61129_c0_g1~~TRINITY_DN61129_c0_g1_i1.p1  ORF type:complete len:285 (-),score=82.48 TRINITY_DN61129_c0_g1_i1:83-811(-)